MWPWPTLPQLLTSQAHKGHPNETNMARTVLVGIQLSVQISAKPQWKGTAEPLSPFRKCTSAPKKPEVKWFVHNHTRHQHLLYPRASALSLLPHQQCFLFTVGFTLSPWLDFWIAAWHIIVSNNAVITRQRCGSRAAAGALLTPQKANLFPGCSRAGWKDPHHPRRKQGPSALRDLKRDGWAQPGEKHI